MKKVMITGASGLIGKNLVTHLKSKFELVLVGRDKNKLIKMFSNEFSCVSWHELDLGHFENLYAVINLAGANVGEKKWTQTQKQTIIQSRVSSTETIVNFCLKAQNPPKILNASAIGIYGLPENTQSKDTIIFDESSSLPNPPQDFLAKVGYEWENALQSAQEKGLIVIKLRFGVVLSNKGGALAKMLPAFKMGLGSVIGTGKQPFSWVSLTDVINAIDFLLNDTGAQGAYNIVAPQIINQKTFARQLSSALNRPCLLKLPEFMVKFLFSQMGEELLLKGQKVSAKRLQSAGFNFEDKTFEDFLQKRLI